MGAEDRFVRAPAPEIFRRRLDVVLEEFVDHLLGLRDQDGLAVGVEARPPGAARHLPVLPDRDRKHPLPGAEPEVVADDHPPGGKIQAGRKGRGGGYDLDLPLPKPGLDDPPLLPREPRMVERRSLRDAGGEGLPHIGRCVRAYLIGVAGEDGVCDLQSGCRALRERFGVFARTDEDQALAALRDRVEDEVEILVLAPALDLTDIVGKLDAVLEEDSLPEIDRSPVALDEFGVEPPGEVGGVPDGRREGDDLHTRVLVPEFCNHHLKRRPPRRVVDKVCFVENEQTDLRKPRRPVPEERVDLLARRDDDIVPPQVVVPPVEVAGGDTDTETLPRELLELLARERPQGDDVEALAAPRHLVVHRHLGDQGLAARRRYGDEEVLPRKKPCFDTCRLRRIEFHDPAIIVTAGEIRRDGEVGYLHIYPFISTANSISS